VEEHPDRVEAWKLLWYSRFWIGYNLRKMKEAGELLGYLGNQVVVEASGHVGITLDSIISAPLRVWV
jgi:hypothetical protein